MRDGQDLSDFNEPLFIDRFHKENYFVTAIHEGGIVGLAQDNDEQGGDNDNNNINTNEDPYNPPRIALESEADHS